MKYRGLSSLSRSWPIIAIILVALGLRLYRLPETLVFHGELGHNYLEIKNYISNHQVPLLGPPTSHEWLSFGPLYYWIFGPLFAFFGYDPIFGGYFFALLGTLLVLENYIFIGRLLDKKVALYSSLLMAMSPLFLDLTKESRFFSMTIIFIYPFLYFLYKYLNTNPSSNRNLDKAKKYMLLTGVFLGLSLNFHFSPAIFILAVFVVLIVMYKKMPIKIKGMYFIQFLTGIFLTNIPFVIYNFQTKFEMLIKLFAWGPYRLGGFIGLFPKNNFSVYTLYANLSAVFVFFSKSYTWSLVIGLLIAPLILFVIIRGLTANEKFGRFSFYKLLSVLFIFFYLGVFIHGDPPLHYFLPVYFFPTIFMSMYMSKYFAKNTPLYISAVFVFFVLINSVYLFSTKWFYRDLNGKEINDYVPYNIQKEAASTIYKDARGQSFSLSRVGEYDQFAANFSQNYMFLLWKLGNEPVNNSKLNYTIYESESRFFPEMNEEIIYRNTVIVTKRQLR